MDSGPHEGRLPEAETAHQSATLGNFLTLRLNGKEIVGEMADPTFEPDNVAVKNQMREKYDSVGKSFLSNYKGRSRQAAEGMILSHGQPGLYWMEHKIDTAFAMGRFSRADRLLEVGCTAGHYTMKLVRDGYQVVGLDISGESIRAAQVLAQDL